MADRKAQAVPQNLSHFVSENGALTAFSILPREHSGSPFQMSGSPRSGIIFLHTEIK
jgi:hypothetical protein